jgi:hypothetical protein
MEKDGISHTGIIMILDQSSRIAIIMVWYQSLYVVINYNGYIQAQFHIISRPFPSWKPGFYTAILIMYTQASYTAITDI